MIECLLIIVLYLKLSWWNPPINIVSLYNCGSFQMIWASLSWTCPLECAKMWSRSSSLIRESKSSKNLSHTGYSGGSAIVGRYSSKIFFCSMFATFLSRSQLVCFDFPSSCKWWLPQLGYLHVLEINVVLQNFEGRILLFQFLEVLPLTHKAAMLWFLHWLPWLRFITCYLLFVKLAPQIL